MGIAAVAVVGRNGAASVISIVDGVVVRLCILAIVQIAIQIELHLQLFCQVKVNFRHGRITTVHGVVDDIVLISITYRSIVTHFRRTARDRHGVVVRERVVAENVEPVGIHGLHPRYLLIESLLVVNAQIEVAQSLLVAHLRHVGRIDVMLLCQILRELDAFHRVHQVDFIVCIIGTFTKGELSGIRDSGFALATALGSHHNHAIGRTRSVESSGGGIFQHVDAQNVLRVDASDGITNAVDIVGIVQHIGRQAYRVGKNDAVEHPQRFAVADECAGSANTDAVGSIDFSTTTERHQVGNLTFEHLREVCHTGNLKFAHVLTGDRTGEVAAVELLITCNHHALKHLGVAFHIDYHIVAGGQMNRLHADIGDLHAGFLGHGLVEIEFTVGIGNGHHLGAHNPYLRTDNGLFVLVEHIAAHCVPSLGVLHQADDHDAIVLSDLASNVGHHLCDDLSGHSIGLPHGDAQILHFVGVVEKLDACLALHLVEKLLNRGILHGHRDARLVKGLSRQHLGNEYHQEECQHTFYISFLHLIECFLWITFCFRFSCSPRAYHFAAQSSLRKPS